MSALTSAVVDEIPLYREGATHEESAQRAAMDPVRFYLRAYKAVGPIYRMMLGNKMVLMLAGFESNEFIWKNTELWTYQNLLIAFREELGDDHVTAIDGAHHRQKRAILKPAFDMGPVMRYLPQYNAIFHEEMTKTPALEKIDLVHWWATTFFRAQAQTVARTEMNEEMLHKVVAWEKALIAGIRLGDARFAHYADPAYRQLKAEVMEMMNRVIDERLAEPDKYDDNFAMVMQARMKVEGEALSRENLIDDLYLVLIAGVENTSRLLSAALLAVVRDPAWLAELRVELDAWDGQDVRALSQMNRLKATVTEVQRLYPTLPFNARESVQEFEFGGYQLPGGTVLSHMQTLCHYLDEFYADPLEFKPQRFMEDGRFIAKTNGFFGGGTHVCLGRNQTLMQTPIALAQTLKYYDLEILKEELSYGDGPLAPGKFHKEAWVRVTPRML